MELNEKHNIDWGRVIGFFVGFVQFFIGLSFAEFGSLPLHGILMWIMYRQANARGRWIWK